jgi:hypothetical protein
MGFANVLIQPEAIEGNKKHVAMATSGLGRTGGQWMLRNSACRGRRIRHVTELSACARAPWQVDMPVEVASYGAIVAIVQPMSIENSVNLTIVSIFDFKT